MKIVTYDCEVFEWNWLITFKDKESGIYTCIWSVAYSFSKLCQNVRLTLRGALLPPLSLQEVSLPDQIPGKRRTLGD